jgi:hypothetical protein
LQTPTECSKDGRPPDNSLSTVAPGSRFASEHSRGSDAAEDSFAIGSFGLVRQFVEHLAARNASESLESYRSSLRTIHWETVESSVADSRSFEQAIGRAVVVADQMSRGVFGDVQLAEAPPAAENPFFPFSVADVVPDFGDESRYRTRVARKLGRIFGARRSVVARDG